MFERYTEKARRVIFFGRYETSQFGAPFIETEHLLLGLVREDKGLAQRVGLTPETVRREIESRSAIGEKTSVSIDLPLSADSIQAMNYAAEEAADLGHVIDTGHLLLGLLRVEKSMAAIVLRQQGLIYERTREIIHVSTMPTGRDPRTRDAEPADVWYEPQEVQAAAPSLNASYTRLQRTGRGRS